jgi:conjugative relaxase-like TrwC/TraI family protein
MALRSTALTNAGEAVKYFGAELGTSEYYMKQKGVWHGKLRARIGLPAEVTKRDFVALMNNVDPVTKGRLTPRTNTTRKETRWELDEQTQGRIQVEREVSNRRIAVDWTFSLEKDKSVYLAITHDQLGESLAYKALLEILDEVQAETTTQVCRGGLHDERTTGEALFGIFIHRTTRPVDGVPDPHWHAHAVMPNFTWDEIEERCKAADISFKNKAYWEAKFHARLDELWRDARYGYRRTPDGLELSVFAPNETRIFCKRTIEIEAVEKKQRSELERKTAAKVKAAAKRGEFLEYEVEYGKLKDKLGARHRKGKDTAIVEGQALEAEWGKQMRPGRWEAITPEAARNGDRIDFLETEVAKSLAIEHAFEKKSRIRDVDLFKAIARFGAGTMAVADMDEFCWKDPRLARNPAIPDQVTTHEIVAEEQAIRDVAIETRGKYEQLCSDTRYEVRDKQLDEGQLSAVKLILENRDLAVAIPGYVGSGKSRTVKECAHAVRTLTGKSPIVLAPTGKTAKALGFDAGANEAYTISFFRTSERLQKLAIGRQIFCDEYSLINNEDGKWLLDYVRANGCRVAFFGDGKQHEGSSRGAPISDLREASLIEWRQLDEIYRQTNVELLAAVQDAADGKFQESVEKVKARWMHVEETEADLQAKLVEAIVEKHKQDEQVLTIALMHRQGEAIAHDVRARLKEEGLLGREDIEVTTLKDVHLSDAQRADAVNYSPGQIAKFHRLAPGGFKSGQAWTVDRIEDGVVIVSHAGKERSLPLSAAKAFQVYESGIMQLAAGDMVQVTKNNPKSNLKTGELRRVLEVSAGQLKLDNGKWIDLSEGVHIRQGYTVTSHGAQGHTTQTCYVFLPGSAAGMMNQRQWLVDISRAREELRVFTDCVELLEQCVVRPEERKSALSLIIPEIKPPGKERFVDLLKGARMPTNPHPWITQQPPDRSKEHVIER